jgi:hypothetical protein
MTPVAVRMTLLDVEIIVRDSATENRSLFYFVFCYWTLSKVIVCDNATKNRRPLTGMRGRDRAEGREEGRKGASERAREIARERRGEGASQKRTTSPLISTTLTAFTPTAFAYRAVYKRTRYAHARYALCVRLVASALLDRSIVDDCISTLETGAPVRGENLPSYYTIYLSSYYYISVYLTLERGIPVRGENLPMTRYMGTRMPPPPTPDGAARRMVQKAINAIQASEESSGLAGVLGDGVCVCVCVCVCVRVFVCLFVCVCVYAGLLEVHALI